MVDDRDHAGSRRGHRLVGNLGIDARQLNMTRRVFARLRGLDGASGPILAGALPRLLRIASSSWGG